MTNFFKESVTFTDFIFVRKIVHYIYRKIHINTVSSPKALDYYKLFEFKRGIELKTHTHTLVYRKSLTFLLLHLSQPSLS